MSKDANLREKVSHGKLFLQGVQVGQQGIDLLRVQVRLRWHHVTPVQDRCADPFIVGGCAAGQVGTLEDALQRRSMQLVVQAIVVALSAVGLECGMSVGFAGCQLREGLGVVQRGAAAGSGTKHKHAKDPRWGEDS